MKSILTILALLISVSISAQKISSSNPVAENNKDVFLLAILLRNHLRETDDRTVDLAALLQQDSTRRISTHFEKIEFKNNNRQHIAICYKFSSARDGKNIQLTGWENKMLAWMRFKTGEPTGNFDGEMQFDFGERLYRIKKIIVKEE